MLHCHVKAWIDLDTTSTGLQESASYEFPAGCHHETTRNYSTNILAAKKRSGIVWQLFVVFVLFFGLYIFLALCGILELEAAISTIFATFRSWKLSFSREFATFGLTHFRAGSCCYQGICSIFEPGLFM